MYKLHLKNSKHLLLLLLFYQLNSVSTGRPPPPPVQINKCCSLGEYLDRNQNCVAGSSSRWMPSVFMIARKNLFEPRGEAPKFFQIHENSFPQTCNERALFTGSNNIIIFSNGSLYLSEKSIFIHPDDYCADKDAALVCFPRVNGISSLVEQPKLPIVKKCCHKSFSYDINKRTCVLHNSLKNGIQSSIVNDSVFEINYGFPSCLVPDYALAGVFRAEQLNDKTGNLTIDSGRRFSSSDFCLEHAFGNGNSSNEASNERIIKMFVCAEHFSTIAPDTATIFLNTQEADLKSTLLSAALLISVIFLSATLATGFLIPSNHHVLHWKCQIFYVSCLLIGDLLLATTLLSGSSLHGGYCISIAIFMHFFFLAAFFWLNIMCFNIWWTFRDFRPSSMEKSQETFRLRIYMIYAWGVPLIISTTAAVLDLVPHGIEDNFLRPHFEKRCWFIGDMEILAFFFGPVGILLLINFILFASTARQLTCGLWKLDDVKSTTERAALGRVCLKLVIVMGVTWIADIISWLVGGQDIYWVVPDLINAFQGVFIFIVVGCQPQVWSAVKRIWTIRTGRGTTRNLNGPQHSSSSHGLPSIGETVTHNTLTNSNTTSTKVPIETVC